MHIHIQASRDKTSTASILKLWSNKVWKPKHEGALVSWLNPTWCFWNVVMTVKSAGILLSLYSKLNKSKSDWYGDFSQSLRCQQRRSHCTETIQTHCWLQEARIQNLKDRNKTAYLQWHTSHWTQQDKHCIHIPTLVRGGLKARRKRIISQLIEPLMVFPEVHNGSEINRRCVTWILLNCSLYKVNSDWYCDFISVVNL